MRDKSIHARLLEITDLTLQIVLDTTTSLKLCKRSSVPTVSTKNNIYQVKRNNNVVENQTLNKCKNYGKNNHNTA